MTETKRSLFTGQFWFGLLISLICIILIATQVPFAEVLPQLAGGDYRWLVFAIGGQLLSIVARAWRWRILLQNKPDLMTAFWSQGIGFLFTNIFPLRLGEPARILILSQKSDIPIMEVTTTAVVERVFDLATVIVFLLLVLPFMEIPEFAIQSAQFFGALVILAFIILIAGAHFPQFFERIIRIVLSPVPKLRDLILPLWENATTGLASIKTLPSFLLVAFASLVSWGLSVLAYFAALFVFIPDGTLVEATFMVVAVSLAITVPSSPGFIGVYQFVAERSLVLPFGDKYDPATGLSIALISYLVYYFTTTTTGIAGIWRLGSSITGILDRVRKQPQRAIVRDSEQ